MELNDDEKDSVEKRKMKYKKQVLLQLAYECINVLWSWLLVIAYNGSSSVSVGNVSRSILNWIDAVCTRSILNWIGAVST